MDEPTTTTAPPTDVFRCSTWNGPLELRAGDEVGVMPGGLTDRVPTIRRVAKVTHKGKRVRLDDGREYNHRAELVGRSKWSSQRLIPVDKARKESDPRQSKHAMAKLLGDITHLANSLAREHGAPLPAEKKAELLDLVERL